MNTAIIFDMDGTLFQTNLILEPAFNDILYIIKESDETIPFDLH